MGSEKISEYERLLNKLLILMAQDDETATEEKIAEYEAKLKKTRFLLAAADLKENPYERYRLTKKAHLDLLTRIRPSKQTLERFDKQLLEIENKAAEKIQKAVKQKRKKKAVEKAANVITKNAHKAMYNPDTKLGEKILKRRFDENPNLAKTMKFKK
jgi:tRNA U34 5-carboxymethylaminomethyl modifying GTPase MnmE/TrmE